MRHLVIQSRILVLLLVSIQGLALPVPASQELEVPGFKGLSKLAGDLNLDVLKLAGNDSRLGELEAYKLIERMVKEKRRPSGPCRKFLSAVLDPSFFSDTNLSRQCCCSENNRCYHPGDQGRFRGHRRL